MSTSEEPTRLDIETRNAQHRATIDKELLAIAQNNRYLNTLAPISKLLPELLVEVFMAFAIDPSSYTDSSSFKPSRYNALVPKLSSSVYAWMAISRVCHHWREVALGTPKIWSHIYLDSPDRIQVFLERSGQHSIHVKPFEPNTRGNGGAGLWAYSPPRWSINAASLRLIFAQVHRLESLSLKQPNKVLERVFSIFGEDGFHAPVLKSLQFTSEAVIETFPSFPKILSRCSLPALKHVGFHGYNIPWDSPLLQYNLTSLTIQHDNGRSLSGPQRLSIKQLLEVLSHMPGLQSLNIILNSCEWCGEVIILPKDLPFVELPCLRTLVMHLSTPSLEAFLTYCHFPSTTTVELKTALQHTHPGPWSDDDEVGNYSQDLGLLTSIIAPSIDVEDAANGRWFHAPMSAISIHLESTSLWGNSDPGHTFGCQVVIKAFYLDPTSIPLTDPLPPPNFTLQLSCCNYLQIPDVLQRLFTCVPLSNLMFLNAGYLLSSEIDAILDQLGELLSEVIAKCSTPNLRTLRLSGSCTLALHSLLENLRGTTSKGIRDRRMSLFGSLQNLILSGGTGSWVQDIQTGHLLIFEELCSSIRYEAHLQKGVCLPFSTLVLEGWKVPRELHFEFVNSISELLHQEGRFTEELPSIPFEPWFSRTSPPVPRSQDNPDADLDDRPFLSPTTGPEEGDWSDHAGSNRVTFDFKGDGGIKIIQNPLYRDDLT